MVTTHFIKSGESLYMGNETTAWEKFSFNKPQLNHKRNPTILAFSCYFHDSSACILKDGCIIAAADEERFTRKKHDAGFPVNAIQYCLEEAGVTEVDYVVFYENPDEKWERIQETLKQNPPSSQKHAQIIDIWKELKSKEKIQEVFNKKTGLLNQIVFLDHHLCHAASSYYMSGFKESAVVTIDGVGEKATTTFGKGEGASLILDKCITFPNSIGLLYTAITVFLGFKANDHEYKVMGLAPYGIMSKEANPFYAKLSQVIDIKDDGSFTLDMRHFGHGSFEGAPFTQDFIDLIGIAPCQRGEAITREHENLAAALQMVTEEAVLSLLRYVHKEVGSENLCYSGGVALNSVLNGKILSQTPFKKIFVQPSAGDSGTVIGAAKYVQHLVDEGSPKEHMTHSYYGPGYSANEIESFLIDQNIVFNRFKTDQELVNEVATVLANKSVVGWFHGRMEWGPRALGNRSILASPLFEDMRDILNEKVKHREMFRPFAPVVCEDDAADYFCCDKPVPEPTDYMLMVYPIVENKRAKIPAVTHVDGSGRLQTIRKEQNHLYYSVIKRFGALTGVPILVNTSFNIRGEPIVCTPQDAYRCMMGTEIDYLVLGNFLIKRSDNLKDSWAPAIED